MIVLANEEFATGLRLAGIKNSYTVTSMEQVEALLEHIDFKEFIIATQGVFNMSRRFEDYKNVIVFPDTISDFSKIDDLKKVIKSAVGSEVEI